MILKGIIHNHLPMQQVYVNTKGLKRVYNKAKLEEYLEANPEVKRRFNAVRFILDGVLTNQQASEVYGVEVRTIQRWKKQYDGRHPGSLAPQSKRPKATPRKKIPEMIRQRIIQVAKDNRSWGGDLIHDYMKNHDPPGFHTSLRTTERVLFKARKNGELSERVRLKAASRTKKKRKNHYEITRVYKSTRDGKYPGDRVNQDVVVAIIWERGVRVAMRFFSCIVDRYSRAAIVRVSDKLSGALSKQAHQDLQELIKMPIECSISDNGAENLGEMREYLRGKKTIQLFTYPSSPKQNAVAERFNKTFQEDCLLARQIDLSQPIATLQKEINSWLVFYNTERPHQKVGRRPPIIKLFQFHLQNFINSTNRNSFHLRHMLWRGTHIANKTLCLL
jgi:transposase InsO family protein